MLFVPQFLRSLHIFLFTVSFVAKGDAKMMIRPFNAVWCIFMLLLISAVAFIYFLLHNSSESKKKWFIVGLCVFNIVLFFAYKGALSVDREFLAVSNIKKFNWFNELPLQLCNINMFLIPIGVLTNKRSIMGFSFFLAPLGALMAFIFPEPAFVGYSLLLPRMIGYYFTHAFLFAGGLSLATLGFYRPRFSDFSGITVTFVIVSMMAHGINFLLRLSLCTYANYFYTYGADISILNLFWKWIPIPYIYELPSLVIMFSYMGAITLVFRICETRKQKNEVKMHCTQYEESAGKY